MTGNQIRTLRERLGIGVPQFAELIGTSPASVWRWEAMGAHAPAIEPFQARLIALLQQQTAKPPAAANDFVNGLASGLLIGGGLLGLYHLLDAVFADDVKPRRSSGAAAHRTVRRAKSPADSNRKKGR